MSPWTNAEAETDTETEGMFLIIGRNGATIVEPVAYAWLCINTEERIKTELCSCGSVERELKGMDAYIVVHAV